MDLPGIISPEFIAYIQQSYKLHWNGVHGWSHWQRVYENGMHLALKNGANQVVVALFAFTHDMARENEGWDKVHGPLAAERILGELQGRFFDLPEVELDQLVRAVRLHTEGLMEDLITVQTCWDADRLDLGRVGIRPSPHLLCTPEARDLETIEWAYVRSRTWAQASE